jgi:hypothetical protein
MSPISRGFQGHRPHVDSARIPPGQHSTERQTVSIQELLVGLVDELPASGPPGFPALRH